MISFDSTKKRTEIAHSVAQSFVKELISNNFNIIIEEIFRDEHYYKIKNIITEAGYICFTIFLTSSLEVLIQRDANRKNKIKGKEIISKLHKEIVPREDEVVIDVTSLNNDEIVNNIISIISKRHT